VPTTTVPAPLRGAFRAAVATAIVGIALTVATKAVRDALFCAQFSPAELPRAMLAGAVVSGVLAVVAARVFRSFGPVVGATALLLLNALALALEYLGLEIAPRATTLVIYLHGSAAPAVLVSAFWLIVNERFDPHTLKNVVPRIGMGAAVGGLVGGLLAERVGEWIDVRHTLLALAALSMLGVPLFQLLSPPLARGVVFSSPPGPNPRRSAYVREIAVFVALIALVSSVTDFTFKARAMKTYGDVDALLDFFAVFYAAAGLVSFVVQSAVTPALLEKAGLGVGLAGLPGALALSGVLALVLPGLPSQTLLRGVQTSLSNSLYRSSYEPLYTPLSPRGKRAVKALVDVVADKLGDVLGSGIVWGLVFLLPLTAENGASSLIVLISLCTLGLALRLYRRYVDELGQSLRSGAVVLDDAEVVDRTTRLTLSRTMDNMTRERLLAEIEKQRAKTVESAPPHDGTSSGDSGHAASHRGSETALAAALADLLSNEPERIRRALGKLDPSLVAFAIPLLSRRDVGNEAMAALAGLGPRVIGQLGDALLDLERSTPAVRRRLARVITRAETPWAASALVRALDDPDDEVRGHVLSGLEDLQRAGVPLPVTRESVLAAATRELGGSEPSPEGRRSEHALRMLGLAYDPEAFRLASKALSSEDFKLRGTALEYLDNVVPEPLRSKLFSLVAPQGMQRSRRDEREILVDLKRSLG
jgi:hypothetical protein